MREGSDPSRTDVEGAGGWLTAAQVAEVLGVKRATVYAYVSRGVLHRRLALDGRTSLFDRQEVSELRRGGRRATPGELRTVLATAITRVSEQSLLVRGHDLVELIESGWGFEQVADLIWQTDNAAFWNESHVGEPVAPVLDGDMPVLDRFRIAVAASAAADPMRRDLSPAVIRRTGPRLITAMIYSLPTLASGAEALDDIAAPPVMARLLWPRLTAVTGEDSRVHALDTALALLADHGLASSTFAVRVAASVRADPYAAVGAGLGAVDGPLHGAASGDVHRALQAMAAGADLMTELAALPSASSGASASIPGFGHTIYRREDPRFEPLLRAATSAWPDDNRRAVLDDYRRIVEARTEAAPNVDLALGFLTWMAGMDPGAGEAIFAVARCAGWLGHAMEEYEERPLRLRPKGHYVGPLPITERV